MYVLVLDVLIGSRCSKAPATRQKFHVLARNVNLVQIKTNTEKVVNLKLALFFFRFCDSILSKVLRLVREVF